MATEPVHRDTSDSMSDVILQIPNELEDDAVAMFHIVPQGRTGFGLSGADLTDFVRRVIHALLEAGGVPVRHVPENGYEWTHETQYGSTPQEIADNVIKEWLALPDDPLVLAGKGVWFARPWPGHCYVKMD